MKIVRVRMNVSIASAKFSYQPNEIVDLPDDKQTRNWIAVGHAERVPSQTPLSLRDFDYRDLDADEVLSRACENCQRRRAAVAFRGRGLCRACYVATVEAT